eukprot:9190556-Pyramimonas_sp.AAC.1
MLPPQWPARGIDYGSAIALPRKTSSRIPDSPAPGKDGGHADRTGASLPGPSPRLPPMLPR